MHAHAVLRGQVPEGADHRREAALHVVGAAPVEAVAVDPRLELLLTTGDYVQMPVQNDCRAAIGPDGGGQEGPPVVLSADHLHVARLEPALDEARGGLHPLEGGRVVGDEALCQSAFIHPSARIVPPPPPAPSSRRGGRSRDRTPASSRRRSSDRRSESRVASAPWPAPWTRA